MTDDPTIRDRAQYTSAMAHELDCVIDGCDASISEDSEEAVLEKAEEHAAEAHPDLELDDETVETIKDHIEEA